MENSTPEKTNTTTINTTPLETDSGTSAKKRTYKKLDFSLEQEEQLIELVKENPALYDPRDLEYKNKKYRDRLLNDFGATIGKTGKIFVVPLHIFSN